MRQAYRNIHEPTAQKSDDADFSRRPIRRASAAIGGVAALIALFWAGVAPSFADEPTPTNETPALEALAVGEMSSVQVHKEPKDPSQAPFKTADGAEMTLSDFEGDVVLVNFWATWCAPCLREMPSIDRLAGAMKDQDFKVVAISLDRARPERSRAFLDRIEAENLDLYLEPTSTIAREMGVVGLPVSVILDRSGKEIARLTGHAEWDSNQAKALVQAAIDASGS